MKRLAMAAVVVSLVCALVGCGSKESGSGEVSQPQSTQVASLPAGANQMCPVMPDEKVDPAIFVEYEGERIYVCCDKCLEKVREDPAAWYAKAYGGENQMQEHGGHEMDEAHEMHEQDSVEPMDSGHEGHEHGG